MTAPLSDMEIVEPDARERPSADPIPLAGTAPPSPSLPPAATTPPPAAADAAAGASHPHVLIPYWIRAFVRAREIGLVLVALVIGAVSGLLVAGLSAATQFLHVWLFHIEPNTRLSEQDTVVWWRALAAPVVGGLILALMAWAAGTRFRGRLADAIEANALHGGRMSIRGSLYITAQTAVSNGFGASVGLEAAYTQICSALSSILGRELAARRADMRMLVGCGSAGAIAAAFGAPLAGAFYAFEVILGAYSVGSLVPVVASALTADIVAGLITRHAYLLTPGELSPVQGAMFGHVVLLGIICSFLAIAVMQGVAWSEKIFADRRIPAPLRPVIGGVVIGSMAILTPQVLASGHGALQANLLEPVPIGILAALIVAKAVASSVSLGSGFRGGLFFASLLLGGLTGRLYAEVVAAITPFSIDPGTVAIAAMAALGTGVVGAPITMTVLALETTGSFSVTMASLVACAIAALVVREMFGYSFATWRFHLRGETIRGPHDVGWVRDLKVSRVMLRDVRTVSGDASVGAARGLFPPGSTKQVIITTADGRYAGLVLTADLHTASPDELDRPLSAVARQGQAWLLPQMTIRQALDTFEKTESDMLAVLDNATNRKVLGRVTEAHALRRYGEELERRNREFTGT